MKSCIENELKRNKIPKKILTRNRTADLGFLYTRKRPLYKTSANNHSMAQIQLYRLGQIKRGQLTFFLVTSELIYKIK